MVEPSFFYVKLCVRTQIFAEPMTHMISESTNLDHRSKINFVSFTHIYLRRLSDFMLDNFSYFVENETNEIQDI